MGQLNGWTNFYVIVGSSAGALIGLQFVVVALLSSTRGRALSVAMRAFATPTIVYLSTVLLTAGLVTVPRHTAATLGIPLIAMGVAGLGYLARVGTHLRAQQGYAPDRGDWMWFALLPGAAYAGVLAAGVTMWSARATALDLVAAASMMLLLVSVHNAWDSAVWIVASPRADEDA